MLATNTPMNETLVRRSILSWLRLRPTPQVYLLGDHPSLHNLARQFPNHVHVEPRVESSFDGVPLFSSVVARAEAIAPRLLRRLPFAFDHLPDHIQPRKHRGAQELSEPEVREFVVRNSVVESGSGELAFVMWNHVARDPIPPFVCGRGGHWQWLLRQLVLGKQRVAVDATSAVTAAMVMGAVPVSSAAHTDRSHSQLWLAGGCNRGGVEADSGANGGGEGGTEGGGDGGRGVWAGGGGAWHCEVNRRLEEQGAEQQRRMLDEGRVGLHAGSSSSSDEGGTSSGEGGGSSGGVDGKTTGGKKKEVPQFSVSVPSPMDLPWAAMPCHDTMTTTSVCLLPRVRPAACPCELAPYHGRTALDSIPAPQDPLYFTCSVPSALALHSESVRAASANLSTSSNSTPAAADSHSSGGEGQSSAAAAVGGGAGEAEGGAGEGRGVAVREGHALQALLPVVADRHGMVVLVAVSDGDQDVLLSFVCMLRHLNITNFLIAATDLPILSFAYLHSLPVFHLPSLDTPLSSPSSTPLPSPHCTSLTCRRRHSMHVRSGAALAIVRLGYHVASTLVDTVWFHNPLPDLLAFGPNAVAIQSSVTDVDQPANSAEGRSTMSTGFFFVRGEEKSAAALAAVVAHAGGSRMAEHLSFFRVLCGENGQLLLGSDACRSPSGVKTRLLNRRHFPTAAMFGLWDAANVRKACGRIGCRVLPSDHKLDRAEKCRRLQERGLWFGKNARALSVASQVDLLRMIRDRNMRRLMRQPFKLHDSLMAAFVAFIGLYIATIVNSLTSNETGLSFSYYSLPFCQPEEGIQRLDENFGEVLIGDLIENSPYKFRTLVKQRAVKACDVGPLTEADVENLKSKIDGFYHVNFLLDNLPVTLFSLEDNEGDILTGIPIGYSYNGQYYLYNHILFKVLVHEYVESPAALAGMSTGYSSVDVFPQDGSYTNQNSSSNGTAKGFVVVGFESAACSIRRSPDPEIPRYSTLDPIDCFRGDPQPIAPGESVVFSFDVLWEKSPIQWASRWDAYLKMRGDKVHWFSILNSLVVISCLAAAVFAILLRSVHRDLARINSRDKEEAQQLADESGWKLLVGDIFRSPPHPEVLCIVVSNGSQLLCMAVVTIFFAALGFMSPASRGALLMGMVLFYLLLSVVSGYVAARMWVTLSGVTVASAVPFSLFSYLFLLWFVISVPLTILGCNLGLREPKIAYPVRTNQIPREIPEPNYMIHLGFHGYGSYTPWLLILAGGILPFGTLYIELYFIMSSMWMQRVYYGFGFLFVVLILLMLVCAEVAVVFTYLQLTMEDYRWWWRSLFASGSVACYVFLFCVLYLVVDLRHMRSLLSATIFLCYSLLMSLAIFLATGTVGFFSSAYFVYYLFSSVKLD
ncbi:unnamed protein product [Closterium sp. Yama58-4]|nr:unnamed protein product [Closterium sp. Yama58-4]